MGVQVKQGLVCHAQLYLLVPVEILLKFCALQFFRHLIHIQILFSICFVAFALMLAKQTIHIGSSEVESLGHE